MESKKNFFNPTQVTFKTSFNKIDNSIDLLLIFDGGDVDGYEKELQDYIQTTPRN